MPEWALVAARACAALEVVADAFAALVFFPSDLALLSHLGICGWTMAIREPNDGLLIDTVERPVRVGWTARPTIAIPVADTFDDTFQFISSPTLFRY